MLIASVLLVLCPEFIKENRLCWLRSPLYIVKNGNKEDYYYTDEELNSAKVTGVVQRNKGLGSLSATQAHDSMFTSAHQRLDVLEYTDEALKLLKNLMGEDIARRKKFVFENVDFSEVTE